VEDFEEAHASDASDRRLAGLLIESVVDCAIFPSIRAGSCARGTAAPSA
jgi:hypothetical protein